MILFEDKTFKIIKSRGRYVLIRKNYSKEFHAHFKDLKGSKVVVELFYKKLVPYKKYFKSSMERITTKDELLKFSEQKQKPKYKNRR